MPPLSSMEISYEDDVTVTNLVTKMLLAVKSPVTTSPPPPQKMLPTNIPVHITYFYRLNEISRKQIGLRVRPKETREGWPLLTVETEVNGDSWSIYERGPSLVGSLGLSFRYKRFLFCLGSSSRPSTKHIFPHRKLFQFFVPILQPARHCRQAAVLGRLSLSLCLCFGPKNKFF